MNNQASARSRRIVARPLDDGSVLTVIGPDAGQTGPWPFVTRALIPGYDVAAPPAVYLALAGWAACTIVTSVGVASRGKIPVTDVGVAFTVEASPHSPIGVAVRKSVRFDGLLSEAERVRIRRAAEYCPVGQALTKSGFSVRNAFEAQAAQPQASLPYARSENTSGVLQAAVPGSVRGQYLADTKQVDATGAVQHEGEVKVYLSYHTGMREGRMVVISGHSAGNWAPAPIPLAQAALAASGVSSLMHAGIRSGFSVEISPESGQAAGSRDQSQLNADAGVMDIRKMVRTLVLHRSHSGLSAAEALAILNDDPLYRLYRNGGILLDEEITFG